MTTDRLISDLASVPRQMLHNYVGRYERGGVQPHPVTSFVDGEGRACIVGAFADADSVEEFAASDACRTFLEGPLVSISRLFEDGHVTPGQVYDACLLELAGRGAREDAPTPTRAATVPA